MFYGTSVWDPVLIVAQIVSVQSLFYIGLGSGLSTLNRGKTVTVDYVFNTRLLTTSTYTGWTIIVSYLGSALTGAIVLYFVVERTKKCLDFTVTCYLFHVLFCALYKGFPWSLEWWITIGLSAACMALVGESLCMKKEMRDIPTTTGYRGGSSSSSSNRSRGLPRNLSQVKIANNTNGISNTKRQRLINFLGGS